MPEIRGSTRVAGIIGDPVAHSRSPAIHNAGYDAVGLDWVFVAFPVRDGRCGRRGRRRPRARHRRPERHDAAQDRCCPRLRRALGDGACPRRRQLRAPHRARARRGLDRRRGARPVLARRGHRSGRSSRRRPGSRRRGTGDRARPRAARRRRHRRGASPGCRRRRGDTRPGRPRGGAREGRLGPRLGGRRDQRDAVGHAAGRGRRSIPTCSWGDGWCSTRCTTQLETPLLAAARARSVAVANGLGMLVHQAAISFETFTGVHAPLEAMRRAAERA